MDMRSCPFCNLFESSSDSIHWTKDMTDPRQARRYRFGVFEADAVTGELRKQGARIKVNVQPFQMLLMLLERPGELLTREEISRELWPRRYLCRLRTRREFSRK